MARIVLHTFDKIINYLTLLLMLCGGMIIHTLTALTIKSYYGDPWGYVSFLLPGVAEFFLIFVQIGDGMYNYSILLATCAVTAILLTLTLLFKNYLHLKAVIILAKRVSQL